MTQKEWLAIYDAAQATAPAPSGGTPSGVLDQGNVPGGVPQEAAQPPATAPKKEETQPAGGGLPAMPAVKGRETNLRLPDNKTFPVRYAYVEAESLIPSHDARNGFKKNPNGDINARTYDDPSEGKAERLKVITYANDPKPDLLLTDTPTATDGPPVSTESGVLLGGNGRGMIYQLVYAKPGSTANALRQAVIESAQRFGAETSQVAAPKQPALVRIVDDAHAGNAGDLSRELNRPLTTAMTADADAVSRARKIDEATANEIAAVMGEETIAATLSDPVTSARILQILTGAEALTNGDIIQLTDPKGGLTKEGKAMVERLLLASVIPDARTLAETQPAVRNKLLKSMAAISSLRQPQGEMNFQRTLLDALASMRRMGQTNVTEAIEQGSILNEPWRANPRAIALMDALLEKTETEFGKLMRRVASESRDFMDGQAQLMGPTLTPAESFDSAFPMPKRPPEGGAGELAVLEPPTAPGGGGKQAKGVTVYHGSAEIRRRGGEFKGFDLGISPTGAPRTPGKGFDSIGVWFTSSKANAENYGKQLQADSKTFIPGAVIEANVDLKNPLVFETPEAFRAWYKQQEKDFGRGRDMDGAALKEGLSDRQGYDGIIIKGGSALDKGMSPEPADWYLVFEPEKIDLAPAAGETVPGRTGAGADKPAGAASPAVEIIDRPKIGQEVTVRTTNGGESTGRLLMDPGWGRAIIRKPNGEAIEIPMMRVRDFVKPAISEDVHPMPLDIAQQERNDLPQTQEENDAMTDQVIEEAHALVESASRFRRQARAAERDKKVKLQKAAESDQGRRK